MHETMFQLDQRKEVLNPNSFPYCSIGIIQACHDNEKHHSVGTIIEPNKIITCASNLFDHQNNFIYKDLSFAFPKDSDFKKVKIKNIILMKNVKPSKQLLQNPEQNIAILELEENISPKAKCLPIFWNNMIKIQDKLVLVGYTYFDLDNNNGFEMAQEKINLLSRKKNTLQYKAYTEKGYSGAPLLVLREQKYQIVGLHFGINKKSHHHEGIIFDENIKEQFV